MRDRDLRIWTVAQITRCLSKRSFCTQKRAVWGKNRCDNQVRTMGLCKICQFFPPGKRVWISDLGEINHVFITINEVGLN